MPNMLNAAQTAEFNEKGFTYARGLFAPDEVKLLTEAMEKDPAARYQRVEDMTAALEDRAALGPPVDATAPLPVAVPGPPAASPLSRGPVHTRSIGAAFR